MTVVLALRCAAAVLGSENIGHALQERVVPVLRRHYDHFVEQVPGEKQSGATPATYVLAPCSRTSG